MKIHCLQHVAFEGLANIEDWAAERGHPVSKTLFYEDGKLPAQKDFEMLVIMGGPMGTYEEDQFPWLVEEKRFIADAINSKKRVLGICLGAQLIASASGAEVFPGPEKEIGWFPVQKTAAAANSLLSDFPETFTPLHWHGDTFDLPKGALRLAENDAYKNQAFQLGDRVLGLQFHLELSLDDVAFVNECCGQPKPGKYVQSESEIAKLGQNFVRNRELLQILLERFERIS